KGAAIAAVSAALDWLIVWWADLPEEDRAGAMAVLYPVIGAALNAARKWLTNTQAVVPFWIGAFFAASLVCSSATAATWHVAPNGTPTGSGTVESPLSLDYVLSTPPHNATGRIKPG